MFRCFFFNFSVGSCSDGRITFRNDFFLLYISETVCRIRFFFRCFFRVFFIFSAYSNEFLSVDICIWRACANSNKNINEIKLNFDDHLDSSGLPIRLDAITFYIFTSSSSSSSTFFSFIIKLPKIKLNKQ